MSSTQGLVIGVMIVAMIGVLGALGTGLYVMVKGGEINKKHGNKLMRWRIGLQGLALAMFAILLVIAKGN